MKLKNSPLTKNYILLFSIIAVIVIMDQVVKAIVRRMLPVDSHITIIPNFFLIWHIQNTGAGFSLLKDQNTILIWVSLIIIGVIIFYHDRFIGSRIQTIAFAFILGGAIGNLIDRVLNGAVTDFFEFFIPIVNDYFPAFNVADSCITIGAIILIISLFLAGKELKKET